MKLLTVLFLLLLGCILTNSRLSLSYAVLGLNLWFQKMIPALLPFMILSGIMVRLKLTDKFAMIVYPVIRPLYRVRKNVCYVMLMGFLCGFPMGARVADDLYTRQMITKREAEYLLAFCNNIGPVYFCSFVLPLLERQLVMPYLFGMYGIPLLYGLILRYTVYKDIPLPAREIKHHKAPLLCCETPGRKPDRNLPLPDNGNPYTPALAERLLEATDSSVYASVQNILSLGGYMILFNLLNLVPHLLTGKPSTVWAPLLEITGGLSILGKALPLYSLLALSFGGFSCIAQTYSSIGGSGLNIGKYVLHKIVLTFMNACFYLCWFLLWPDSFLC